MATKPVAPVIAPKTSQVSTAAAKPPGQTVSGTSVKVQKISSAQNAAANPARPSKSSSPTAPSKAVKAQQKQDANKTKPLKINSNPWQPITVDELQKHTDVDNNDAWMAIKGVVYDVAAYAAKHPGGAEKIRKYCGKDATEVFDIVHSYVAVEDILEGHRLGVLKGDPKAPKRNPCSNKSCCFGRRYKPPTTYFRQDSIVGTYIVMFYGEGSETDWTVGIMNKTTLHVFKCMDRKKAWLSIYELPEPLLNDAISLLVKNNAEVIEITLRKPIPATAWANQNHGLKDCGRFVNINMSHSQFDAWITSKKCLTNNIMLFGIQLVPSARIGVPIGFHVDLYIKDLLRPYTPVCFVENIVMTPKPRAHPKPDSSPCILYFIIKIYPNGPFTQLLDNMELDDGSEIPTLKVSTPFGYFPKEFLHNFSLLFLLAGGTGLAPMIRIMQYFSTFKDKMRGKSVALLYFSEKLYDLVWHREFIELEDIVTWFNYFPVLTKPSEACNWRGIRGRINNDMLRDCMSRISLDKIGVLKAIVCGPPGFNKSSVESLAELVISENIIVFN